MGSKIAIIHATNAYFNKTWTMHGDSLNGHWIAYTADFVTNITETASPATQTGYPGLIPYFSWGNDTQSTPVSKSMSLDFWSMAIDAGNAGVAVNSAVSRYF